MPKQSRRPDYPPFDKLRTFRRGGEPFAFPQVPVIETFTGGVNDDVLSAYSGNWSAILAGALAELEIQSEAATAITAGVASFDYWDAAQFGPSCEAYFTLSVKPADTATANLDVRMLDPTTAGGLDGYRIQVSAAAGVDSILLRRMDSGTATTLVTFAQEVSNGDSIGIRCIGSLISAYYKSGSAAWMLLGSINDATYAVEGFLMIGTTSTATRIDNVGAGTIPNG